MKSRWLWITRQWGWLAVLVVANGCHLRPDWGSPGDMNTQRTRSLAHDPYPSSELGPEIMGARPRGFDRPRSEVTQLQSSPTARKGQAYTPGGF